jgi:hypothetical protein
MAMNLLRKYDSHVYSKADIIRNCNTCKPNSLPFCFSSELERTFECTEISGLANDFLSCNKFMAIQVHLMHLYVVQNKHDFALKLKFELLANSLQVESRKCQNIADIGIHIVTYTLVGNLLEHICVLLSQLKNNSNFNFKAKSCFFWTTCKCIRWTWMAMNLLRKYDSHVYLKAHIIRNCNTKKLLKLTWNCWINSTNLIYIFNLSKGRRGRDLW